MQTKVSLTPQRFFERAAQAKLRAYSPSVPPFSREKENLIIHL